MLKQIVKWLRACLWVVVGVFIGISLFSYHPTDPSLNTISGSIVQNWAGLPGSYLSDFLIQGFGWASWLIVVGFVVKGMWIFRNFPLKYPFCHFFGFFVLLLSCSVLLGPLDKGGVVGFFSFRFLPYIPKVGQFILWTVWICLALFVFQIPVGSMVRRLTGLKLPHFSMPFLLKKTEDKTIAKVEPVSSQKKTAKSSSKPSAQIKKKHPKDGFNLPPVSLLDDPKAQNKESLTKDMMDNISRRLEAVLGQFGVKGTIQRVSPGPVVTLYEFEPAAGVKTARVIGLAEDIARAMSVVSVRMAVIPGSSVIGIEMPNKNRQTVFIKELIDLPAFAEHTGALPLILGKNIGGNPYFADLAKMPHLLVAGTTGSGKSVGINTMILSLLYRFTPDECRLIMVDPKMLELSVYNGIPHLLTPVVTEPGKAVVALKWTVREMDDRYRQMANLGVRNIELYNKKIAETLAAGKTLTRQVQTGFDPETGRPIIETQDMDLTPMPYIVVIVDEMADLMLTAGKDIEIAVSRIAAKARAAGIHMIMATQRPSVDVITGTIKANFPSRIAFQVTSKFDSVTIIGDKGAEQLLGRGDMLFMAAGMRPVRLHGPFVSDEEVERVVSFLKEQGDAQYVEAVMEEEEESFDEGSVFDRTQMGGEGDLYEKAKAIVLRDKKPSISYVQRQLRIGYNRAADLIDRMEAEGVVSKASPTGRREILTGDN